MAGKGRGHGGYEQAVCEDFFAGAAAGVVVGCYDHHPEEVLDDVFYLGWLGLASDRGGDSGRAAHPPCRHVRRSGPASWWAIDGRARLFFELWI